MLDYDDEARHYDATRGGEPRARAAAEAVERLLPQGPCTADLRRTYAPRDRVADVCRRLAALPDQDTARPDPTYRLIALKS